MLKLIHMVIKAGEQANVPVAMCGEMAGDFRYTRLLLALGLRELSMHPATLPQIRHIIQNTDIAALAGDVGQVLTLACSEEVEQYVDCINANG